MGDGTEREGTIGRGAVGGNRQAERQGGEGGEREEGVGDAIAEIDGGGE